MLCQEAHCLIGFLAKNIKKYKSSLHKIPMFSNKNVVRNTFKTILLELYIYFKCKKTTTKKYVTT